MSNTIETSRLKLRPWNEDDIEQLTLGLNDFAVAKWLAFVPHPYLTSQAKEWVSRCRELSNSGNQPVAYEFAVELRQAQRVIGGVSLSKINWHARTGGGGIWIANGYQGCGYGSEAFTAKIRFAFCELGLTSLLNGYFDGNENSWAMQRKLGYQRVSEAPIRCMADGRQTVEHQTMLLRSQWKDNDDR